MPSKEDVANQVTNQQVSVTDESHPMNAKLHPRTEPHLDVELQNETGAHSNFEVSIPERDAKIPY